jgi:hypothetical protein
MTTMQPLGTDRHARIFFIRDALISFGVLLLAYAAYDDITTDNDTDFRFEYAMLVACTIWFGFVALRLIRVGHQALGGLSLLALVSALWAQLEIGRGITPGLWPAYVVTTGAFLWFLALATVLLALGWRRRARPAEDWHRR